MPLSAVGSSLSRRFRAALLCLAVFAAGLRLWWIWCGWLDGEVTLADDAFYYFQIARHVAQGLGPTFDGLAPTNGFHPLYLVVLSGFYSVWPASAWIPVHAALSLLFLFDLASAWFLYRIASRWGPHSGYAAALLWLTCPLAIATSQRGMESSLSTLLVLASIHAYLGWLDAPRDARRRLLLGGLLGLAVLARTENALLLLAVGLCALAQRPRKVLQLATKGSLPFVGIVAPWLYWQWRTFGTWEQSSGTAIRMLSIYGHLATGTRSTWPPAAFVGQFREVLEWVHRCALAQEFRPLGVLGTIYLWLDAALLLLILVAGISTLVRPKLRRPFTMLAPLLLYAVLHVGYYYSVAHTYRPWYHLTIVATVVLASVALAGRFVGFRAYWTVALLWTGVHIAGLGTYAVRAARFDSSRTLRGQIAWIEDNCGPASRIGLMNAGKLAYLAGFGSQLTIVNLDGVVNNVLLDAYRSGTFPDYYCRTLDYALELPTPDTFLDRGLRASYERFRAACVWQVPTRQLQLFRIRCDDSCQGAIGAPRDAGAPH